MPEALALHPSIARVPTRRRKRGRKAEVVDWRTFEPSAIDTGGDDALIAELLTYKKNLDRLLERRGQYVLIKGDEVVSYCPTLAAALDAGAERFGEEPALIKEIVAKERAHPSGGLAD